MRRGATGRIARGTARAIVGLVASVLFSVQCHHAVQSADVPAIQARTEIVSTAALVVDAANRNEQLARSDPLRFIQYCLTQYQKNVHDYRCTFAKQELLDGRIAPLQKADVRFMEQPFSVDMTFVSNVRECLRALYVAGKWADENGNELAWAKPGGAILRAFVPRIKQPIHGPRAQNASRRTIDQFGFGKTFELIIQYSLQARSEGALRFEYVGHGLIDGRPTYVFERHLPFDGDETRYPDARLVIHIDQEFLVPTGCFSYADEAGESLLGSYVYSDVKLNVGYTPADFDPDVIKF